MNMDHPLADNARFELDLNYCSVVMLASDDPYQIRLERVLSQANVQSVTQYEVETSAGACAMVREGLGISAFTPFSPRSY